MSNNLRPRAAHVVFVSQVLWGFAYYGVYSLLTSFFSKGLNFPEKEAIFTVSVYGAMGPIFTFIGGVVSDKLLGVRRSYLLGYLFYCCGFFLLGFSAMLISDNKELSVTLSLIAVAILSIARGTANSSNQVILTKSHQKEDKLHLLDVSYSYMYMLNNIGSTMGSAVFPILIGTSFGLYWGYKVAFILAGVLLVIAVVNQLTRFRVLYSGGSHLDEAPLPMKNIIILCVYFIILFSLAIISLVRTDLISFSLFANILLVVAIIYFVYLIFKVELAFKFRMIMALIIYAQLIVFYIYYNQMFTSLILYPVHIMMPVHLLGFTITGEFTMIFNALWCVLGSPIVIGIISSLRKRNIEIHVGYKFVIGMALTALSYFLLYLSTVISLNSGAQNISIFWMFIGHAFVAIAELFVLNLAISSLSVLVPKKLIATILGMNLLTMGISSLLSGKLASKIALEKTLEYTSSDIFHIYKPFFLQLTIMAGVCIFIFIATTYIMKFLEKKANEAEQN